MKKDKIYIKLKQFGYSEKQIKKLSATEELRIVKNNIRIQLKLF